MAAVCPDPGFGVLCQRHRWPRPLRLIPRRFLFRLLRRRGCARLRSPSNCTTNAQLTASLFFWTELPPWCPNAFHLCRDFLRRYDAIMARDEMKTEERMEQLRNEIRKH